MNEIGYSVSVEDIEPGHWVAYVLALSGCFSSGETEAQAVSGAPEAVQNWFRWMYGHAGMDDIAEDFLAGSYSIGSVESCYAYAATEDSEYLVNAFFEDDARPLILSDLLDGLELMEYTRADLLAVVKDLSPKILNKTMPGNERF